MNYPQSPLYNFPMTNEDFINDVEKAINGEYSAIACYKQLAENALSEKEKKQILEIRKDEIRHFQVFSVVYMYLTGQHPQPKITEFCPKNYREGLKFALEDEQETVDFYLNISNKTFDPYIKEQFRLAAADEQNHAVWFLYFMQNDDF